jgi:hypothetical protein
MKERLIETGALDGKVFGEMFLTDFLTIVANNIEESMLQAGAMPGTDYTYRDIYQLAIPFAIENAKAGSLKWGFNEYEGPLVVAQGCSSKRSSGI